VRPAWSRPYSTGARAGPGMLGSRRNGSVSAGTAKRAPATPQRVLGVVYGNRARFGPLCKGRWVISPRNSALFTAGVPGLEPRTTESFLGPDGHPLLGQKSAGFRGFHSCSVRVATGSYGLILVSRRHFWRVYGHADSFPNIPICSPASINAQTPAKRPQLPAEQRLDPEAQSRSSIRSGPYL
jgi:hypothetical protein